MAYVFNIFTGTFDNTGATTTTWQSPVANFAALPSVGNANGDARITLDTFAIYIWNGSAWTTEEVISIGAFSNTPNATGLDLTSGVLTLHVADTTHPGGVPNIGAANGVASLDSGGKVPVGQLPSTVMLFLGNWNASTNTPTLADGTGTNGDTYRVSVAGSQNLGSGVQNFLVGDWVVYNGTIWQKSPGSDGVISVNGNQGVVVVNAISQLTGDVTAGPASGSQSEVASLVATSNATLTTLSALSLPGSQVTGNISGNAANVTGVVAVANGGTGQSNLGTGAVIYSNGPTLNGVVISPAGNILESNGSVPTWTTNASLGGVGTNTGQITLNGNTSGSISIKPQAVAGTYEFDLPTTAGTTGQVLTSQGGAGSAMTWTTPVTGTVTSVSVVSANGLAGTVATATTTPAITLSTTLNTPVIAGNGTALIAATTTGTGSTVVLAAGPTLTNPVVGTQAQMNGSTLAASTSYVDIAVANAVSGINPAIAVQAATTSASDTSSYTYNNGVSGVGATFTGPTNTALTVDGFTFTTLGQRLLVKNDTQSPSGAFNGIYYVTQLQTSLLPLILTRALDYDQPSDINNTGAIPVINGTVNGTTSWVETALITTVGTSPLTFAMFTGNPANYVQASSGDIAEHSFVAANNVSSPTNITNLSFSTSIVRYAKIFLSVYVDATSSLYEGFELQAIQNSTGWYLSQTSVGDNSGFTFTITSAGQVQYTDSNYAGFVSASVHFRALTLTL